VSRVGGHKAISLLSTVDFANVSAVISIKRFGGQGFPNIFSTGIDSCVSLGLSSFAADVSRATQLKRRNNNDTKRLLIADMPAILQKKRCLLPRTEVALKLIQVFCVLLAS